MFSYPLKPHQRAAVEKIGRLKVGALYMDMRTGKTRTALEIGYGKIAGGRATRMVWITPVSLKDDGSIVGEIRKQCPSAGIYCFDGATDERTRITAENVIVGAESLSSSLRVMRAAEEAAEGAVVVVDESDLFRNADAIRTRALERIGARARYRYVMSGTPVGKGIEDLYAQMHFLDPRILGYASFGQFAARHLEYSIDTPRRVIRRHHVPMLMARIEPYIYQVRRQDCMTDPVKRRETASFLMPPAQRAIYQIAKEEILFEFARFSWTDATIYRLFTALQQAACGFYRSREKGILHAFDTYRDNPRASLLAEQIATWPRDAKLIIWCRYMDDIDTVRSMLAGALNAESAEMTGRVTGRARNDALTRFRTGARFLVATAGCGGRGRDLTCADGAIYYSSTFKFIDRIQSEDRIIGPDVSEARRYAEIVAHRSIDEIVSRCLCFRRDAFEAFRERLAEIKVQFEEDENGARDRLRHEIDALASGEGEV